MAGRSPTVQKEIGTALAVLAIYLLTLLLPVHQAAGLQRDLSRLGFETADTWSVCTALAEDENGDTRAPQAAKCPAASFGKTLSDAVYPPAIVLAQDLSTVISHAVAVSMPHAVLFERQRPIRAPPVAV